MHISSALMGLKREWRERCKQMITQKEERITNWDQSNKRKSGGGGRVVVGNMSSLKSGVQRRLL